MPMNASHSEGLPSPEDDLRAGFQATASEAGPDAALRSLDSTLFAEGDAWLRIASHAWRGHGEVGPGFVVLRAPMDVEDLLSDFSGQEIQLSYLTADQIFEHIDEHGTAPFNLDDHLRFVDKASQNYDPHKTALVIVWSNPTRVYRWTRDPSPPDAYLEALDRGWFDAPLPGR